MFSSPRKGFCIAAYLAVSIFFADNASGGEVRKYELEGSRNYGWYGFGGSGTAFLTGSFEVELDFEAGVGTLLSLETQLTQNEGAVLATEFFESGYGGFPYEKYRPPIPGALETALLRPTPGTGLIPQYIEAEQNDDPDSIDVFIENGFFETAGEDSWVLFSDGSIRVGDSFVRTSSYIVYLEGTEAFLSITLPVTDDTPSIASAPATLIPEPRSLVLLSAVLICTFACRGCFNPQRISP